MSIDSIEALSGELKMAELGKDEGGQATGLNTTWEAICDGLKGIDSEWESRTKTGHDSAILAIQKSSELFSAVRQLFESASKGMCHRNAKEREAYKRMRAVLSSVKP